MPGEGLSLLPGKSMEFLLFLSSCLPGMERDLSGKLALHDQPWSADPTSDLWPRTCLIPAGCWKRLSDGDLSSLLEIHLLVWGHNCLSLELWLLWPTPPLQAQHSLSSRIAQRTKFWQRHRPPLDDG